MMNFLFEAEFVVASDGKHGAGRVQDARGVAHVFAAVTREADAFFGSAT
jgi:hypothetical protein